MQRFRHCPPSVHGVPGINLHTFTVFAVPYQCPRCECINELTTQSPVGTPWILLHGLLRYEKMIRNSGKMCAKWFRAQNCINGGTALERLYIEAYCKPCLRRMPKKLKKKAKKRFLPGIDVRLSIINTATNSGCALLATLQYHIYFWLPRHRKAMIQTDEAVVSDRRKTKHKITLITRKQGLLCISC